MNLSINFVKHLSNEKFRFESYGRRGNELRGNA
jgi:hypothetical protein